MPEKISSTPLLSTTNPTLSFHLRPPVNKRVTNLQKDTSWGTEGKGGVTFIVHHSGFGAVYILVAQVRETTTERSPNPLRWGKSWDSEIPAHANQRFPSSNPPPLGGRQPPAPDASKLGLPWSFLWSGTFSLNFCLLAGINQPVNWSCCRTAACKCERERVSRVLFTRVLTINGQENKERWFLWGKCLH